MKKIYGNRQGMEKKLNVYNTLKNAIQFLEFKPGAAISEAELIAELGVSRTPIREALIRLADELLVEIYPQRGTFVSKIDIGLAKEMAYMRHIVETEIFMQLCRQKADVSNAVAESMFFMSRAIKNKDVVTYIQNDGKFHGSIFSFAKHEMIWNIISNTRTHYVRLLMLDLMLPNTIEESYQDHEKIVECIVKGKMKELTQILKVHHDYDQMKREAQIKEKFSEYLV